MHHSTPYTLGIIGQWYTASTFHRFTPDLVDDYDTLIQLADLEFGSPDDRSG